MGNLHRAALLAGMFLFTVLQTSLPAAVLVRSLHANQEVANDGRLSLLHASAREFFDSWNLAAHSLSVATNHTDRQDIFSPGESLSFSVTPQQDGNLTIISINEHDEMVILYPNEKQPSGFVTAGKAIQIPQPGDEYSFKLGSTAATDLVKFILTASDTDVLRRLALTPLPPYAAITQPAEAVNDFSELSSQPGSISAVVTLVVRTNSATKEPADYAALKLGKNTIRVWIDQSTVSFGSPFRLKILAPEAVSLPSLVTLDPRGRAVALRGLPLPFEVTPGQVVTYPPFESGLGLFCASDTKQEDLLIQIRNQSGEAATATLRVSVAPPAVGTETITFHGEILTRNPHAAKEAKLESVGDALSLTAPPQTDVNCDAVFSAAAAWKNVSWPFSREVTIEPTFAQPGAAAGLFLQTGDGFLARVGVTRTENALKVVFSAGDTEQSYIESSNDAGQPPVGVKLARPAPEIIQASVQDVSSKSWTQIGTFTGTLPESLRFGYFCAQPASGTPAAAKFQIIPAAADDDPIRRQVRDYLNSAPTRDVEEQEIRKVIERFVQAMESRNPDTAAAEFAPEVRDRYREMFREAGDKLPEMAKPLKSFTVSSISRPYGKAGERRSADLRITASDASYSVRLHKVQGRWFLYRY